MMSWYGSSGQALWTTVTMVLFWGGVIALAVWAIRSFAGPHRTSDSALDVLRKRLAAGEITPEEFEKTKKVLGA